MPYYKRNLYILSLTIFLASVCWNQVIPFLPLFMKTMGVKGPGLLKWVGIVFALQSGASIIGMPIWGKLGDKYGRKPMTIRAGFCLAAIYFGTSLCQTPLQLAILRFMNGGFTGFIPSSMALIATNTPEKHAARSIAIATTAGSIGLIIGPVIGGFLPALVGYRGSMRISAISVFICTILVWILVREPNKATITEQTSILQDLFVSLRSKVMSSVMLTVLVGGVFTQAIYPLLALHLSALNGGASLRLTGGILSLPPLALALTAVSWTALGERRGHQNAIRAGLLGTAVASIGLAFAHGIVLFAIVFFIAGVFMASLSPCTAAVICTKIPIDFRSRAYGMQLSAGTLGTLIAPLAATRVAAGFGIPSVFIFVAIVAFAGLIAFSFLANRWGSGTEDFDALESSIL